MFIVLDHPNLASSGATYNDKWKIEHAITILVAAEGSAVFPPRSLRLGGELAFIHLPIDQQSKHETIDSIRL